jgi:transposase
LDAIRALALQRIAGGEAVTAVMQSYGLCRTTVYKWQRKLRERGGDVLLSVKPTGRPPRLTARQRGKLLKVLLQGATAHGFSTDLWTLPRVATVIARTFGVTYHPAHVWKILRGEGWSCQKPERRAKERDEAAIQRWRTETWPHIKKRPPRR